jgi:putative MATE family efflux protein
LGFLVRDAYCNSLSADPGTAALAGAYLNWFIPALALQFPLVTLGSALRATGAIKPSVVLQVLSVVLNGVLAPFLIFGIGPWPRMGVSGAALATFISILATDIGTVIYFEKKYRYLRFRVTQWAPQFKIWWTMLKIGIPAGAEFVMLSIYIGLIYAIVRPFGAAAQAGFGVGARVMQAMFLPVVALSFAVSPLVGQNFGGRKADRVRHAVMVSLGLAAGMMLALTIITWLTAPMMIRGFSNDPKVIAFGSEYLKVVAFNFVAAGIVFSSSSVFQGIGNTMPPLISSASRLLLFALPAWWVSRVPGFHIRYVWYLSVFSQVTQACLILLLLRRELRHKLKFTDPMAAEVPAV